MTRHEIPAESIRRRRFLGAAAGYSLLAALAFAPEAWPRPRSWLAATPAAAQSVAPDSDFPGRGEWTAFRGDAALSGLARGKGQGQGQGQGRIEKPRIRWRYDLAKLEGRWLIEPAAGERRAACCVAPQGASIDASTLRQRFRLELPAVDLAGRRQPPVHSSIETFADVFAEYAGLERFEFPSAFNAPTVAGQWQNTPGRCFGWRDGAWRVVWQIDSVPMNFAPYPIVDDFDRDGRPEIAVLPWYELRLYDARTGALKHRCRFTEGRSYGALFADDLDGDGTRELIVMADFAKHVDVFGFRGGKLSLLWRREIELDISNPQKILRVVPQPTGDLDGDGVKEVVFNAYNETGDRRWRIVVCDGLSGRVKAEWPDEVVYGQIDLEGNGTTCLLTSVAAGQGVPEYGPLRVRNLRGGVSTVLWEAADAGWQLADHVPPLSVQNYATLGRRGALAWAPVPGPKSTPVPPRAYAVLRKPAAAQATQPRLAVVAWERGAFRETMSIEGPGLQALALDERGAVLVRAAWPQPPQPSTQPQPSPTPPSTQPPSSSHATEIAVRGGRPSLVGCDRLGTTPGPVTVVRPRGEARPTLVVQGPDDELIALHAPAAERPAQTGLAAQERWRTPGRCQGASWPGHFGAVAADLRGDGGRQILFAAKAPSGAARLVARDVSGSPMWHHDFAEIPGDAPVWNVGGLIFWSAGRFTGRAGHDVLVTVRRSMMHSEETCLLSGVDGRELWRRPRQISSRGCGGQPFAVADFNGDGRDDAASLHPSIYYILDGATGKDLVAKDCTWPGVPMQPVYWGQPVAIPWPGRNRPGTLFTTGSRSMIGAMGPDGSLAWSDAHDRAPNGFPAIGDFCGRGGVQILWIGFPDGVRCYEPTTGKVLWTLPLEPSERGFDVASAVAGDINSDGRDEAVFVVGQRLVCVGADASGVAGKRLWTLELPVAVSSPAIADATGDGRLSILLVGADASILAVQ